MPVVRVVRRGVGGALHLRSIRAGEGAEVVVEAMVLFHDDHHRVNRPSFFNTVSSGSNGTLQNGAAPLHLFTLPRSRSSAHGGFFFARVGSRAAAACHIEKTPPPR